ncbi:MAG: WecB/TagA/CpsF family glycosyltransferase, partial [Kiritimatiellae bacterium]|nr:WecB/TagA/CpsF family glycosyltransferase [Kiritimatiellia bacterium]
MSALPPSKVMQLGPISLSLFGIEEYIQWVGEQLRDPERKPRILNFVNAHLYNMAVRDENFRGLLSASDCIVADGMSIVWAANLFGYRMRERCNLTEAFRAFLQNPDMPQTRCLLIGGDADVAEKAAAAINEVSPHCHVERWLTGYGTDAEYEACLREHGDVDMILLGMGSPKSERIARMAAGICQRALVWHIGGGTVMFYGGMLKEAPVWMRRAGIQWIHRLLIEPRRMWRRYLIGNPLFIWNMVRDRFGRAAVFREEVPEESPVVLARNGETERISLMGVNINAFTLMSLHDTIADVIRNQHKAVVANVNAYAMNIAWEQSWFREFLNRSEYVFCDGHGVMLAARVAGLGIPQKITYADWFPRFCEFCAEQGFSLFFLGGEEGVAEKARDQLVTLFPALNVRGCHNGFFDKHRDSEDNQSVVAQINQCKPDVLLTSFGMPLQESWLKENWNDINARIALPGGACLDYMAGKLKRPPAWMTNYGFEWLGRLYYEPRRLWKRYLIGNPLFFLR